MSLVLPFIDAPCSKLRNFNKSCSNISLYVFMSFGASTPVPPSASSLTSFSFRIYMSEIPLKLPPICLDLLWTRPFIYLNLFVPFLNSYTRFHFTYSFCQMDYFLPIFGNLSLNLFILSSGLFWSLLSKSFPWLPVES